MNKRDVVKMALDHKRPPYVPWSCDFTMGANARLAEHFGEGDAYSHMDNHILSVGGGMGNTDLGDGRRRDGFGVVWDCSVDQDIGVVEGCVLPEPTLKGYEFPDPCDPTSLAGVPGRIAEGADCLRVFSIGFSLYERAWTLRGMANLMMDFYDNPAFVHELLNTLGDWNIARVGAALEYDIDAVYFGDDWGQQHGLQMGPALWREFIRPVIKRMYARVRDAGKYVFIHSCGDVDEVFDDLVEIGLSCFNPFQPEVMDVWSLLPQYRGRLAFHGGLSIQKTLPYGTVDDVRTETHRLLELGADGDYIFAPAHAVPRDVPTENLLAFIDVLQSQPGYVEMRQEA